ACSGTTPICDVEASMCVGCSEHEQCLGSACNFADGNCIDPANVVHVHDDINANCSPSGGTEDMPYCTIAQALSGGAGEVVIILHEIGNEYTATTSISKAVAIFAATGEQPTVRGDNGTPAFEVTQAGDLFLRGVSI